jgi:NADPH2:quinone reductase
MKAVVITKPGSPDVLQWLDRPVPEPGKGEVLLKVEAAGVNRPDVAQRKGYYPAPPGASQDVPGLEVSGTVVKTGTECRRWKSGDKICALISGGGYAEFCVAPEGQCLPVPHNLSFVEAASLPETVLTVWSNVFERGRLRRGESLLIHGGTSGIGVTAIQMAKAHGSSVYTTAGTDEKCKFCESLGADKAINYKSQSFKQELMKATSGKGVDVILDMVGGDYTQDNIDLLAEEGRLVLINFMKGDEVAIKLSQIMRKRLTITGSTLRARDLAFKLALASQVEEHVWPWLISGKLKPILSKVFPMSNAPEAHRLMESSAHIGKIVLSVNQE